MELLRLDTQIGNKTVFLTSKRYEERPRPFLCGSPSRAWKHIIFMLVNAHRRCDQCDRLADCTPLGVTLRLTCLLPTMAMFTKLDLQNLGFRWKLHKDIHQGPSADNSYNDKCFLRGLGENRIKHASLQHCCLLKSAESKRNTWKQNFIMTATRKGRIYPSKTKQDCYFQTLNVSVFL